MTPRKEPPFLSTMLAMMGLGLLEETSRGRLEMPWGHFWFALLPLYALCYGVARWRYR